MRLKQSYLSPKLIFVLLLLLAWLPTHVAGQEPKTTPTPAPIYLPFVQADCVGIPPLPLLQLPVPEAVIAGDEPVSFKWHPLDGCVTEQRHYTLQIATDLSFNWGTIVYGVGYRATGPDDEGSRYRETAYTLAQMPPGVYYWRVSAYNGLHQSDWSGARKLTIKAAPTPNQLLANPSFEDDPASTVGWQWLSSNIPYHLVNDAGEAQDGRQYLAASRQNGATGNQSFYQDIAGPQSGQTYHFAIWVRASGEAGSPRNGRVALWAHGGSPPREHSTRNFQVKDTGWHCVETSLRVSQPGHAYLRAEVYMTSLDGDETEFDGAILRVDGQNSCPPAPPVDGATLVTHGQGFDTCAAPSPGQLAAWKQSSPYEYLGIYLGGANHYAPCKAYNQQYQTAAWFAAVSQQGWRFIPIWVGPQAPCTAYTNRISSDMDVARSQGQAEAQLALQAAYNLGLLGGFRQKTIIYYDMEYYSMSDTGCHNAANAFLEGWVSGLQAQGQSAGIYGAARAVNSWYLLKHVPDSVWIPWYISPGYNATMSVGVANAQWVTESYWNNHRLFQYSGSHNESWAGVTLNIDNDTASGLVALERAESSPPTLQTMGWLAPEQGWLLVDRRLFWSRDGGESWQDITPASASLVYNAFFLDTSHGWVVSTSEGADSFSLSITGDGGQNWQTRPLQLGLEQPASQGHLYFINERTGWLTLKLATGPSFDQGLLFKTGDGGVSWTPLSLPGGGPVRFVDETTGWTVSGATGSELYVTRDGGRSWQSRSLVSSTESYVTYSLPLFTDPQEGTIALAVTGRNGSRVELFITSDGGNRWQPAARIPLRQPLALGVIPPLDLLDARSWIVAGSQQMAALPAEGVTGLEFLTPQTGWAQSQSQLWRTLDGGQSWGPLPLPGAGR